MKQFLLLLLISLAVIPAIQAAEQEVLTLPIRFHIARDVTMEVKDQTMDMWIKPSDLTGIVLNEVNRIWKPAGIRFESESCTKEALLSPPDRVELIRNVEKSKRGDEKSGPSSRTASIARLIDRSKFHSTAHNIYLLPFIGSTYQGYANIGGNRVVVGIWTDKAFKGKKPPVKTLLVEPEPMKVGSLARTIAHELGHNLGLLHPPKVGPPTGARLMGGRTQGYDLTEEEISKARKLARKRIATIGGD